MTRKRNRSVRDSRRSACTLGPTLANGACPFENTDACLNGNRLCKDRSIFNETLDVIKFVCKDLWAALWDKQVDNLRTNHRGVYVLQDNTFKPISRLSSHLGRADAMKKARLVILCLSVSDWADGISTPRCPLASSEVSSCVWAFRSSQSRQKSLQCHNVRVLTTMMMMPMMLMKNSPALSLYTRHLPSPPSQVVVPCSIHPASVSIKRAYIRKRHAPNATRQVI